MLASMNSSPPRVRSNSSRRTRDPLGTREAKRRYRAVPKITRSGAGPGLLVGWLGIFAFLLAVAAAEQSFWWIPISSAGLLIAAILLGRALHRRSLLLGVLKEWAPRGIRCLIVGSDSPVWSGHIADEWVPRIGSQAALLNWSERSRWPASLETELFRHFCVAERNFVPAVIVFRGLLEPHVYRFYYAFHEAKGGRPQYLQELEQMLLQEMGIENPQRDPA